MKRKIIAVLMAVAMTVSLAACGSSPDSGSGSSSSESNESNEKDADDSKDSADRILRLRLKELEEALAGAPQPHLHDTYG